MTNKKKLHNYTQPFLV